MAGMHPCRGDLVSIETWFQPEGRMCACRNWIVRDATTMQEIGRGTRYSMHSSRPYPQVCHTR